MKVVLNPFNVSFPFDSVVLSNHHWNLVMLENAQDLIAILFYYKERDLLFK